MSLREQIGLSGFAIGIPLLLAWGKLKMWEWQANRDRR